MKTMNDQIQEIGIRYDGTLNACDVVVQGAVGWSCVIPLRRMGEFCNAIGDIDFASGEFLHKLKGQYLRVTLDDMNALYSLHHITKSKDYVVNSPTA